jgi:FkbM family methyltransferase
MDFQLVAKRIVLALGFDVVRRKNVPRETFLGLTTRRFDCVLDVGANDGGFARWIAPILPAAPLHCFEPLPAPATALRRWAAGRAGPPVTVYEVALSDHEGDAEILEHLDHSASSSFLPMTTEGTAMFPLTARAAKRRVKVTTLDTWASTQQPLLGRSLLKLDVQGLEDRVLRGAQRTLSNVDACIVEVSIARLYAGQAQFASLVSALHAAGLDYYGNLEQSYDERGAPIFLDCVFVRQPA